MAEFGSGSNEVNDQLNGEEEVFGHHSDGSEVPAGNADGVVQVPVDPMAMFGAFIRQMERINAPQERAPASNALVTRFKSLKPEKFLGTADSAKAERWIQHLEDIFEVLECTEVEKRKLAVFQLADDARSWWELVKSVLGVERTQSMNWNEFKDKFLDKYFPATEKEKKEMEFMTLSQGAMSVTEYQNRFEALSRFAPHLISTPERRARKFALGLVPSIRRMVIGDRGKSYEKVIEEALSLEEDTSRFKKEMEDERKWRSYEAPRGNQDWEGDQARKKQRTSNGSAPDRSRETVPMCYHCGGEGHMARGCTKPRGLHVKCHNCNEIGHYNTDCKKPRRNNGAVNTREGRMNAIIYEPPRT